MNIRGMVEYTPLEKISYESKRITCRVQKTLKPGDDLKVPGQIFMRTTWRQSEVIYFTEDDFNEVIYSKMNKTDDFDVVKGICDYLLMSKRIPENSFIQNVIVLDGPSDGCQLVF